MLVGQHFEVQMVNVFVCDCYMSICRKIEKGDRFIKFHLMFEDIGKKLNTAMGSYNKALGSIKSRIIPSMNRLKDMGAGSDEIQTADLLDFESELNEQEESTLS